MLMLIKWKAGVAVLMSVRQIRFESKDYYQG